MNGPQIHDRPDFRKLGWPGVSQFPRMTLVWNGPLQVR